MPLTSLDSPDTLCFDTSEVIQWAKDKKSLRAKVDFLTEELTEEMMENQIYRSDLKYCNEQLIATRKRSFRNGVMVGVAGSLVVLLVK